MTNEPDLLEDDGDVESAPPPADADLKTVAELAQRVLTLEDEIAVLEAEAQTKKNALKEITEHTLPLALTQLGMTKFELTGGGLVGIKEIIAASISEANKAAAHAWLEKNGHGSLIKRQITITFGKGEEKWAAKFMRDLAQRKKPVRSQLKEAVNYQTLGAFVREQIVDARIKGKDPQDVLPYTLLGVFEAKIAEVKLPKVVG